MMVSKKKDPVYLRLDLKKIFLTPPDTKKERFTLVVVMVLMFMLYFGPLTFTAVSPIHAILISCVPTATTSWAWIVLLRFIGRKERFSKDL